MREHITPNRIANQIRMRRTIHLGTFLIVEGRSDKLVYERIDIQTSINSLKHDSHDPWQVGCGHDLICILSIGLSKKWGSWNYNDVKPDILERELRLAYEESYFRKTQLSASIQKWEENNQPYQILRAVS